MATRCQHSITRNLARLTLLCTLAACAPARAPKPARRPVPLRTIPPLAKLDAHRVVPAPASVMQAGGAPFSLTATTTIVASDADAARVAEAFATLLRPATGFRLPVSVASDALAKGAIALRLNSASDLGAEGYDLNITPDSITLSAAAPAGLFYGAQTLRQLLPAGIEAEQSVIKISDTWTLPPGRIVDRPRFAWRGAMLDVARHFFTVDEVKQLIDLLALYKLNRLHLHLADDQGWRVQIDSWPLLTTIGGSTEVGGGPGGFYTKDDYGTLVRYAQDRFVTIVPEIDMPGHTNAAIASYPQLGCSKPAPGVYGGAQPAGLYTGIHVGFSALCSDSAPTYKFVDDVVREIAAMTPGPYFHVGGDEVEVLSHAQYASFIERVQQIVSKYGKTMVGWEEIGRAKLLPTTLAQQWKTDSALLAMHQGAKLILSPSPKTYLDMKYSPATELGHRWAGYVELRTTYDWDPVTYLQGVTEQSIAGVEAPLWSETVQNITSAEYLLVPRLPALAEVGWSAAAVRGWESFRARIGAHAPRWRLLGINYYPSPQVAW